MKKLQALTIAAFASVAFFSCTSNNSGGEGKDGELSGKVRIDGSSTVFPISEAVAEYYHEEQPDVDVIVNSSGTGGGFKKFTAGETEINDASRPIKDKEKAMAEENGIDFIELPVAYDGLAVVVSKKNNFIDEMTVEELKKLWEPSAKGTITQWSQVREGWPDEEIKLYGPGTASGTFDYFTDVICGEEGASRSDYSANEDDNVLVSGVSSDPNALGYFGLAYYEENSDKLKLVAINNGTATVKPSLETVMDKSYAPLSRPLFNYVNSKAAQQPAAADFVKFYLQKAGEVSKLVGYIPMTDEEYKSVQEKFDSFLESNKAETTEKSE